MRADDTEQTIKNSGLFRPLRYIMASSPELVWRFVVGITSNSSTSVLLVDNLFLILISFPSHSSNFLCFRLFFVHSFFCFLNSDFHEFLFHLSGRLCHLTDHFILNARD